VILADRGDVAPKADDPIYGASTAATWQALRDAANEAGIVDFGIDAFPAALLDAEALEQLVSPKPDAPVLMPAYADLWSQTSPVPRVDPDVALFLHGPDRSPASVQIVWRADLGEADLTGSEDGREHILEVLALVPPRAAEVIEVPLWAARAWLRRRPEMLAVLSDATEAPPEEIRDGQARRAFRYAGSDSVRSAVIFPGEMRPGDLIVVPAAYGGCDEWGWNPTSQDWVSDRTEAAAWPYRRRRYAVRVTAELVCLGRKHPTDGDSVKPLADVEDVRMRLRTVLAPHIDGGDPESALAGVLGLDLPQALRRWLLPLQDRTYRGRLSLPLFYPDGDGVIFAAPFGLKPAADDEEQGGDDPNAPPATESDDVGLATGHALLLRQHSDDVRGWARCFADRAGFSPKLSADIALAGYLHDLGKRDARFQAYLAGGDLLGWSVGEELAKSGRDRLPRDAWKRAGLPENWRHEAWSVRLALEAAEFAEANDRALVLWLVGVHHGFGRPLFPHMDPAEPADRPGPQRFAFDFAGRDWAQIFEELKRRYGVWGLAWLEAFVRLADHRASEAAERRYAESDGMNDR
jgi:CRISPR-associated endonuclease/helicase Cas3